MGGVPSHSLGRWVTEMAGGHWMGEVMKKGVMLNKGICQILLEPDNKKKICLQNFAKDYKKNALQFLKKGKKRKKTNFKSKIRNKTP